MMEIITLENAVMIVTASPITMAGFNCEVTAKALQIPSTWTRTGLSPFNGLMNASLFCLLNNAIISLNYLMNLARPSLSIASTPSDVNVAPVTASTLFGSPAGASFSTPSAMPCTRKSSYAAFRSRNVFAIFIFSPAGHYYGIFSENRENFITRY